MARLPGLTPDAMVDMLLRGMTNMQIAESLGVNHGALWHWTKEQSPDVQARLLEARAESAEAWLDRSQAQLDELHADIASGKYEPAQASALVSLAKARAQENARIAAVRNPKYRDSKQVEHSGNIELNPQIAADRLRQLLLGDAIVGEAQEVPDHDDMV